MSQQMLALSFMSLYFSSALAGPSVNQNLADALLCKGKPEDAVYSLVDKNENFKHGFAVYGFGEETSYRAIVILCDPLKIGSAITYAVVSETENSNYNFGAFTYARFKGDYREAIKLLSLVKNKDTEGGMGEFVSNPKICPQTIALTPLENGEYLLGCGWYNGC